MSIYRTVRILAMCVGVSVASGRALLLAQVPTRSVHIHRNCKDGVTYSFNKSEAPVKNLASGLEEDFRKRGRGMRVNVIGHGGATVEDLMDVREVTGKIGFEIVHLYWVADSTGKMIEITMDGPVFQATSEPK